MSVDTQSSTINTKKLEVDDLWQKVQEVQARAAGGFLRRTDVGEALSLFKEYTHRHPTCKVTAEATTDHDSHTVLTLEKTSVTVRRTGSNAHLYGSRGLQVEFDFLADDDRGLFEELKDEGFGPRTKRKQFSSDVGTDEPPEGTVTAQEADLSEEPTEETLKSLFKVNKHARKYADKAQSHYRRNKHYSAKRNSAKKEALYGVKAAVLSAITDRADRIEKHKINGEHYACLYYEDWSFHCPIEELDLSVSDYDNRTPEVLQDFEKDADVGDLTRSLKESLIHLHDTFGVNANEELPRKRVGDYFIGWKYLG